jgi:hypothetical protein
MGSIEDYPYNNADHTNLTCDTEKAFSHRATVDGYEMVPRGELNLRKALSVSPVSVGIDAFAKDFMSYKSGADTVKGFGGSAPVKSSRASPAHKPREGGLAHPADASRTNLADVLGLLFQTFVAMDGLRACVERHVVCRVQECTTASARTGSRTWVTLWLRWVTFLSPTLPLEEKLPVSSRRQVCKCSRCDDSITLKVPAAWALRQRNPSPLLSTQLTRSGPLQLTLTPPAW